MFSLAFYLCGLLSPSFVTSAASQLVTPAAVASQYGLATSTFLPFPTATLSSSDAASFLKSSWSIQGSIGQSDDLAFVADPFPSSSSSSSSAAATQPSGPVLQVTYPSGSYSHNTGGAQFYAPWSASSGKQFQSMVLTYEVAFDTDFNWVKGGKLPGLRGGPDAYSCSGGNAADGANCFTARLMWREGGKGEVYAYILPSSAMCSSSNFTCNSDGYGTSIDRGSFSFVAGQWNRVTLYVSLNNPLSSSNGQVSLYYDNVNALTETDVQYRDSFDVNVGGLFFSTFFGGSDSSWSTPQTVHSYFRDFQMWGNASAVSVSSASSLRVAGVSLVGTLLAGVLLAASLL